MGAINTKINLPKEEVMDNLKLEEEKTTTTMNEEKKEENTVESAAELDAAKLAELKKKIAAKKELSKMKNQKEKAIKFGVLSSGQCGNRLAQEFYSLGVDVLCLNTAPTDLAAIKVPETQKILLDNKVGGAAKSLDMGEHAALTYRDEIKQAVESKLSDSQVIIIALSLGGGSGSGSAETLVDIVNEIGKPIVMLCVLPQASDDGLAKSNSLVTLSKLSKLAQAKRIASIICIDNAKIEQLYSNVSQLDFFQVANHEVVSQLDTMNTLAATVGITKAIDPMEFFKILLDGEGFSVYGSIKVYKYDEELDIADALISNLENNLLSSSFDIKQAKYCGIFLSANETVWRQIPSAGINYCVQVINSDFAAPHGIFKGSYVDNNIAEDCLVVHFMYSGLGLPSAKINALKEEVAQHTAMIKSKSENRNISLEFDAGADKTLSKSEEIKAKVANRNSAFGKFISNTVDRRKK